MDALAESLAAPAAVDPMVPRIVRVRKRTRELPGHVTLEMESADGAPLPRYRPGQFTMMYVFGVGEIPVSISGDASDESRLVQTVRSVGAVSEAVTALQPGDLLGLRGPFGTAWPTEELAGQDVVVVAGGLGLAPLRPSIYHLLANRGQFGKVVLLYGTRSPQEILYRRQLELWRRRLDLQDRGDGGPCRRRLARKRGRRHAADPETVDRCASRDGTGLRPGGDDALCRRRPARYRTGGVGDLGLHRAQHEMRGRAMRPLPVRRDVRLQGRRGGPLRPCAPADGAEGDLMYTSVIATSCVSWPGLARPPTTLPRARGIDVGGRAKPGHDTGCAMALSRPAG